ncbi:hypothetical protein [Paraburkholderia sp.]|jgi:hypothetical protein|uniref:hypothetical protein n=1 Tax=Paraburkholderia sp. TaxID=1926495 RepID=UPI002F405E00
MNHHQLEKDIEHLEHVMQRIGVPDRSLPLSYWRERVNSVTGAVCAPSLIKRVKRLDDALRALEAREQTAASA